MQADNKQLRNQIGVLKSEKDTLETEKSALTVEMAMHERKRRDLAIDKDSVQKAKAQLEQENLNLTTQLETANALLQNIQEVCEYVNVFNETENLWPQETQTDNELTTGFWREQLEGSEDRHRDSEVRNLISPHFLVNLIRCRSIG